MADVRISALPQQQTALTGLELVPIVQNGLTVQTTISLINALSAGGVTTFSGGATGLLPSSPTVGAITLAGMLNATYGGTGIAAYAAGDLLRANSTTTLQRLAIGTNGQVLTVVAGAPAWAAVSTGTVTSVSGTGTVNGLTLTGTVTSSGNLTLGGVLDLSSPPAIGGTVAAAGTFTTLRVDSTISLAGSTGTAGYVLTSQGASAPTWTAVSSGSGNVVGPASATANGIALFDGTTGLLLKNSANTDALIRGMTLGLGSGTGNFASTALGVNALLSNTTGSYNVAFGYDALSSNTTGEYHAAFGFQALDSQTTGTENTAVGYWALQSTTTGGYNTAIGGFAGSDLTTGSNNLFLGVDSGNNLTTGANNVYIGKVSAFSPSESNNLVFGDGTAERWRITDTGAWYINANTGTSGQVFTSNGSTTNPTWTSLGTMSTQNANAVAITGGSIDGTSITVADNVFTLQDNLDTTKQAQFQLSGLLTGTTYVYTLPTSGSGASTLVDLNSSQTISATKTLSSATQNLGSSANTGTQQFAYGATTTGNTKTVNIGTGGLSGSTTTITVGSANGSTTTMLGSTVIGGAAGNQSLQVNNVASAVNYAQVSGAVAGGAPILSMQGTDTNIPFVILAKGTSDVSVGGTSTTPSLKVSTVASQVNSFQIYGHATGNSPTLTAIGTDTNIGLSIAAKGTGTISISSGGQQAFNVSTVSGSDFTNYYNSTGNLNYTAAGGSTNINFAFASKGTGAFNFATGGGRQAQITDTASAVNYLQLTGGATGLAPILSAAGSDTNIGLKITPKGSGIVTLTSDASINGLTVGLGGGSLAQNIAFGGVALPFNTTGNFNVAVGYQSMFYNKIGSSNVGLGFATLFLNTTANNNLAVGVSALSVLTTGVATLGAITAGSGYTNGTYTAVAMTPVSGATFVTYPTVTVVVSGGAVTGVTLVTAGQGASSVAATSLTVAAALIGGTGSGFSIMVGSFVGGANNTAIGYQAGSALATGSNNTLIGYQAAASTTTVNNEITLGNSSVTAFRIPGLSITAAASALTIGTQFAVTNTTSAVNYLNLTGAATGLAPVLSAAGSDATVGLNITSKSFGAININTGTGTVATFQDRGTDTVTSPFVFRAGTVGAAAGTFTLPVAISIQIPDTQYTFKTNASTSGANSGLTQFVIIGAASAVNYVQATGAATGADPTISAAGSDANIGLVLNGKGTGVVALGGTTTANSGFRVNPVASSVNYVQAQGAATGIGPVISVEGTDANIGFGIRAKGSFNIAFQTSGGAALADFAPSTTGFGVNLVRFTGAGTGNAPELSAQGSDTNINLKLTPKGTGVLQFGTYTAGIIAQAGYITITDAGGTSRRLLVG